MARARIRLDFEDKDLWYFVGLIATDGNLSSDGRHIDITSKDLIFLETIKKKLGLGNKVGVKHNGGREYFHIQFANRNFYDFLLSIGLTPRKSLTIGELKIPDKWFPDFLRGVTDGDGNIRSWTHSSNGVEQWSLRIYSASSSFVHWLEKMTKKKFGVIGHIHQERKGMFTLKFGKLAAKQIFKYCYYEGCMGLDRKIALARTCILSDAGWSKSKTVFCEV